MDYYYCDYHGYNSYDDYELNLTREIQKIEGFWYMIINEGKNNRIDLEFDCKEFTIIMYKTFMIVNINETKFYSFCIEATIEFIKKELEYC